MDEQNIELEEELDNVPEATDTDEDVEIDIDDTDEIEVDDDFNLDEDGNIVIPEDNEEAPEEEAEESDEAIEEKEEAPEESKKPEAEPAKADEKDTEIAELKKKYESLLALGKDALKKMGVDTDDVVRGLAGLAAETSDQSPDEYLKEFNEKLKAEEVRKATQHKLFEERAAKDLQKIHETFPETKQYTQITDIPNIAKMAKYLDEGMPADEAYAAVNHVLIAKHAADSAQQRAINSGKSHLQSIVPKGAKDTSVKITRSELDSYREMFPDLNDKQIAALYSKVKK